MITNKFKETWPSPPAHFVLLFVLVVDSGAHVTALDSAVLGCDAAECFAFARL